MNILRIVLSIWDVYKRQEQVFMADNDQNQQAMKEIILPIRQDGAKTKSYSGCILYTSNVFIPHWYVVQVGQVAEYTDFSEFCHSCQ